jgi:NADH-quinone oxidoreductase subunit J
VIVGSDRSMNSVATPFLFYLLAAVAVAGGLLVITRRKATHSGLALSVTLFAVAGLYLMLSAPFVAGVQIVVYSIGIVGLFLLVVALMRIERSAQDINDRNTKRRFNRLWPVSVVFGCGLLALFASAIGKGRALFPDRMISLAGRSNTQEIAKMLYGEAGKIGEYTLAFEITSLLLLVAILGAVVMTRKS